MVHICCVFTVSHLTSFAVMVFDATAHFQGHTELVKNSTFNLGKVEELCPKYDGEPPLGSMVCVLHTLATWGEKDNHDKLSLNLHAVVILALPEGSLHSDDFYHD